MATQPSLNVRMTIPGLAALKVKAADQPWIGAAWRRGLERLGEMGEAQAKRDAPRLTGKLAGSIIHKVQNKPMPLWVAIRVKAKRKGYAYPRALNYSTKWHHKGWLDKAIQMVLGQAGGVFRQIAREIEQGWGR